VVSNLLMCSFRFDDQLVWSLLGSESREKSSDVAGVHAAILMSGRGASRSAVAA
jgi:flagellar transcriptional activator FlhD